MVEKVNFNSAVSNVQFRANDAKVTNPVVKTNANVQKDGLYVDKETAEAIKNYVTNPVNMNSPVALNDYKNMLVKSGLVEGKDFEVATFEDRVSHKNAYVVRISDKNDPDKIKKVVYWKDGDGVENYNGCVDTYYLANGGDHESFSISRDNKGRTTEQSSVYKNPENHKNLFPENIDFNTTPDDYTKILDSKNVNYKVNARQDSEHSIVEVVEYADNGKTVVKKTYFENGGETKAVDQIVFNQDGKFMHVTSLVRHDEKGVGDKLYVTQSIDEIMEAAKKIAL